MDAPTFGASLLPTQVYRHSGKLGASLLVVPLAALVAVPILSVVYAYIEVYSRYISVVFMVGFAVAITLVVSKAGYAAKCRNATFLRCMGFLAGLLGLYASWVAFVYALLSKADAMPLGLLGLFLRPATVWELAKAINAEGWYSFWKYQPTGAVLWALWGIEAAVVIGFPMLGGQASLDDELFCENCHVWCPAWEAPLRFEFADRERLAPLLSGDIEPLATLPVVTGQNPRHLRVHVHRCPACRMTAAYRVESVNRVRNDKGKLEENVEELSPLLLIQPLEYQKLEALAASPAPTPAPDFLVDQELAGGQDSPAEEEGPVQDDSAQ